MDMAMTAEDAAFRDEVRAFFDAKLSDDMREASNLTSGVFAEFEIGRRWHTALYEQGWIAPAWPTEHGGTGWTPMQRYIYDSEAGAAGAPRLFSMGLRMVGPVVMKFGTDEQKNFYLPRIRSGEDVWCQGYSEPGSGSDLASLQTRAIVDGDDYVVNGTKLWTTGAQHASRMFCLVRTSTEGKRQEGISFILIDMNTPGIKIEPIISISGDHEVNQVFLDDVRVPIANRIGPENDGWTVAKYLLEFERGGAAYATVLEAALNKLRAIAESEQTGGGRLIEDDAFAAKMAALEVRQMAVQATEHRIMSEIAQRGRPGPASSMMKVLGSENNQLISELAVEATQYYAAPYQPEARVPGNNAEPIGPAKSVPVVPKYLNFRAATIYAGSSEVQRNIMAKLVLGL
ncbi:MAG: acyl-CoA dehydrogenase [Rhodospirillaceae bacterium]|jgi:alkylation response protein AidB-like acyl-CoA dehydrogenase|nr:acyl-CoA dehydrogenase [Rhodospirillaceae bacterium]MBT3492952.1 acyl-CoA dehydrogenase [Rhodospirillaceae bacterium]MBT3780491.1 acyl-CoA dehydrogenase [Rhodospirillaceae bacterium]MBT3977275.1 acyl-CoA dehydrogenase [Rhodospirillaceae bacterium]MBT4167547.1 acyl-CoA dehydrogenase [Rhodospirillaceae bacterium]